MKCYKTFIYCVGMSFVALLILVMHAYRVLHIPMLSVKDVTTIIEIKKTTSAATFVNTLFINKLISSPRLLLLLMRLEGKTKQLKAGIYQVYPGESFQHLMNKVVGGDVLKELFHVIEGTTQKQIALNLSKAPYLLYHDVDWLEISARAEGLLLAESYLYNAGSDGKTLLKRANASLMRVLNEVWLHRAESLPYKSSYELLIAASIIEKEAAIPAEKRIISSVIVNRLHKNIRLQMDPTVIYALGDKYHGVLSRRDLNIDSPYNTYKYSGLPPTPIAMVGMDALSAAAHPDVTAYLYYVARGDGSHEFSKTYEEQRAAILRYIKPAN